MAGEEDEAVTATIADIMAKTSGTEGNQLPSQESNSTSTEQQQHEAVTQKPQQKQVGVEAAQQQQMRNQNGVDSSSTIAAANPLSVCGGGRRSTSADSERSLRLEIAESSGGGTSGAESSPLATPKPIAFDNACVTTASSVSTECTTPTPKRADRHTDVEDKTPVAETAANIAHKENDRPILEEQPSLTADISAPAVVESKEDQFVVVDQPLDITADVPPPTTPKLAESVADADDMSLISTVALTSSSAPSSQTATASDGVAHPVTVPLVSGGVTTITSAIVSATATNPMPTLGTSGGSTIVTVSIAGKSAAGITAAAAAAAARSAPVVAGGSAAAPAPPALALMRLPIQPTPVTRILPRPTAKKAQQQQKALNATTTSTIVSCSAVTPTTVTSASTIATPAATTLTMLTRQTGPKSPTNGGGASVRAQFTSGSASIFSGPKTMTAQQHQQNATGVLFNGSINTATTKFATVVPQRVGGVGGSCVAPQTPVADVAPENEQRDDYITDTVNRVAAGTEISPPHKSTPQTTTTTSSTAATPVIATGIDVVKGQQLLRPKPPKKKKNTAAPKLKNVTTVGDGSVDELEQRNVAISVVDMQQQQPSSTASLFPVCSAGSSDAPGGGMLFPPNFALAAASNGTVGATSLMAAYPNGGAGGGIPQYFIRQTTSSGHHQFIPVIPSQQQFFFSPMSASTEPGDPNSATANAASASTPFQGQTSDEQQQRMVVQQQQQQLIRNVYFRSGNDILLPAMVSNSVVGSTNVNLSSSTASLSQNSTAHQNFVTYTQPQLRPSPVQQQQKGPAMVGIQPKGTISAATRTVIASKGGQPTGEGPSSAISAPVVMIGGPHQLHPSYQQLAHSQQQYFLTPTGAIVTLQAPPHHVQQHQHFTALGNARIMPSTTTSSMALAAISGESEQCAPKNANSSTSKVSSPKRKRKIDAKNVTINTANSVTMDNDPTKYLSQQQMAFDNPPIVDEEENEPPPVLCRVFNRSEDEPIVSSQSVESVFHREAKIIRERMFDVNGKRLGPLKHLIEGFEIEEDIEPFPCEHQQLLDKLRREQEGLEAENGDEMQKETAPPESATVLPGKNAETGPEKSIGRRKGRKRTAIALSASSSSGASSPTRSPKTSNAMETDICDRIAANSSHQIDEESSAIAIDANGTNDSQMRQQQQQLQKTVVEDQQPAGDSESITASAMLVKKGRRRELDGLLKMDFGKHSPFQTSDPDKYAQEVLIEARQQQRTLALAAQEEQRNARRSVESSCGGSTTGKSSKRDKYAKKPFSPPVSPLPESRSVSVHSTTPTVPSKTKNALSSPSKMLASNSVGQSSKDDSTTATLAVENKLKTSPKDPFSLEQRRSGGSNVSDEGEERCLYCRRSFKEVPRDKDHVQYCSKACRKQLKAAKRMKHSGGSFEDGLNSVACEEQRTGVVSATPSHRRSDPSSSSDSSGQQQSTCHITSPLGSAFSAMQPQMLSKRRLPVDQHAEQLMSMNQRLSTGNGSGMATSFAPPPFGQSPPDQTPAVLAVPMAVRPTSGAPSAMIQYGTPTAMYFNAAATHHHQMVVSSSSSAEQQAAAVHAYQQQHQQMLYTSGAMPGGSQQQHFFPPIGPSGAHPGTPTPFLPSSVARHSSLSTAAAPSSSSPATPVPTPTSFIERNADIDALVTRGVHTWTREEVAKWVNFVTGSDTNGDRFVDEDVDGTSLLCLSQEQLKTELKFKLGPAIKLWSALEVLKRNMMC